MTTQELIDKWDKSGLLVNINTFDSNNTEQAVIIESKRFMPISDKDEFNV